MTLKQLEAFVRIANNKSFTLAAKELFITQPTVSAYINNLEEELGARLFDRTTKEVQLSEEGDSIYLYAKEMLELADKIQSSFSVEEDENKLRQVVISTSSIPGQFLVPEILSAFKKKFPEVDFKVRETDSEGVVEVVEDVRVVVADDEEAGGDHQQDEAERPADAFVADKADDKREKQVELKFDGNRPDGAGRKGIAVPPPCPRMPGI